MTVYAYVPPKRYGLKYEDRGSNILLGWGYIDAFTYIKDEIKGCEGSKWNPDIKMWSVKAPRHSRRNAAVLGMLTRGSCPDTIANPFDHLLQPVNAVDTGRFEPSIEFRQYQKDAIERINSYRQQQLEADMGLGKTPIMRAVANLALEQLQFSPDSTVSKDPRDLFWTIGSRGALMAWTSELHKWTDVMPEKPQLIMNSPQGIRRAMEQAPHPPFVLCIDESANFKNPTAQRTKLLFELAHLMDNFWQGKEYIVTMTGTPVPKDPTDLWAPLEALQPGFIREKNKSQLTYRLAHTEKQQARGNTFSSVVGWRTDEVEAFYRRLQPLRIIIRKSDVESELPAKLYERRELTPSPGILSAARFLAESLPGAQALIALRQLSDGFQYEDEEYNRVSKTIKTPKDDELLADLEQIRDSGRTRCVVWAAFHASIDKLTEIITAAGWNVIKVDGRGPVFTESEDQTVRIEDLDTDDIQTEFQQRNLDKPLVFLGNPDSAGEGLTLTAADTMVYYSNTFKGDKRQQSEDRIHRIGMDQNIAPRIIDYLHLPTDALVLENLAMKKDLQDLTRGEILESFNRMRLEGVAG
jgi:hypothetical protein